MIEDKFAELLSELRDLTEAEKVEWQETSNVDCFTTLLKSGGVQIEKFYEENDDGTPIPNFEATLLNAKSRPIQTLNSFPPLRVKASLLRELFDLARFNARRCTDVLDGLLTEVHGISK